ncbi:MAG: TonB C-terminal domain-containing protein [Deltaproteobacteria bacterium]|nr:TonB C-terminal domain-containing protein [Deltaproteobacteria bacterium]
MAPPRKKRNISRDVFLALLASLLLHQTLFMVIDKISPADKAKAGSQQVSLMVPPPPSAPKVAAASEAKAHPPRPRATPRPAAVRTVDRPDVPQGEPSKGAPSGENAPSTELASLPPAPAPEQKAEPPKMKLELGWDGFERAFGEEAQAAREDYSRERVSSRRGTMRFGATNAKVMKAIATNRGWVRPDNQEPMGARQKVFRSYLEFVHDRIHVIFADEFLGSLSSLSPTDPLNDMDLMALVEFEILGSGEVNEARVVRSSGLTVFDAAAVSSIYGSSPVRPPPRDIMSYNERVYLRWGFYRNARKCGPFNAEPYILSGPGGTERAVPKDKLMIDG